MNAPNDARERILAAARIEMAQSGRDVGVRAIAKRAGVTPAMINYYFGGKQSLYDAVVGEARDRLHARLSHALADGLSAPRLAAAYFDFLAEEQQMQRLLLREVLDGGSERVEKIIGRLRALLSEELGVDDARIQSALSIFGAIAGYFIYAPVLGQLVDEPLASEALARRRRHVIQLASRIEELEVR